jgi:hypothetical protein
MTGMPAFGPTHQDEEIWNIVGFVRHLPEISAEDFRTMETQLRKSPEHEKSPERSSSIRMNSGRSGSWLLHRVAGNSLQPKYAFRLLNTKLAVF